VRVGCEKKRKRRPRRRQENEEKKVNGCFTAAKFKKSIKRQRITGTNLIYSSIGNMKNKKLQSSIHSSIDV
jgi:hypothetical protein